MQPIAKLGFSIGWIIGGADPLTKVEVGTDAGASLEAIVAMEIKSPLFLFHAENSPTLWSGAYLFEISSLQLNVSLELVLAKNGSQFCGKEI